MYEVFNSAEVAPECTAGKGEKVNCLINLIKEIRHSIDGTPLDQVVDEVTTQQLNAQPV